MTDATHTRDSDDLFPCPICGCDEAHYCIGQHSFADVKIMCGNCCLESPLFDSHGDLEPAKAMNKADALAYWNRRISTPIPLTPSDEMVEAGARALWDNYQSHSYTQWSSNDLMYGKEWRGKIVPWEYVNGPKIVESVAKGYRNQAKACLQAALNLMGGKK